MDHFEQKETERFRRNNLKRRNRDWYPVIWSAIQQSPSLELLQQRTDVITKRRTTEERRTWWWWGWVDTWGRCAGVWALRKTPVCCVRQDSRVAPNCVTTHPDRQLTQLLVRQQRRCLYYHIDSTCRGPVYLLRAGSEETEMFRWTKCPHFSYKLSKQI